MMQDSYHFSPRLYAGLVDWIIMQNEVCEIYSELTKNARYSDMEWYR